MQYFVTGATGFIGRHLLPLLVERGRVTVLVREGSMERWQSVRSLLPASADLQVVMGSLGDGKLPKVDDLGLAGCEFVHLAAVYDLMAPVDTLLEANVDGTRAAMGLAKAMGARCFHHVSSIAVAGDYRGRFTEEQFDEGQRFPHPYMETKFAAEKLVREGDLNFRIYRPAIVVGSSVTGEADRSDGPYYAFTFFRKMRDTLPIWMPLPGPEGGPVNLVPVDFVARAIDAVIAASGKDGMTFHIADPSPCTLGETLNIFSHAAHAPEFAIRFDRRLLRIVPKPVREMAASFPAVQHLADQVLRSIGIPSTVVSFMDYPATFDTTNADAVLSAAGISCPPLATYAETLWDYWLRHLDPTRVNDATIATAVRGRTVVVTGASSGIGRAAAVELARHGAVVIGISRTREKLEEVQQEIEARGGVFHVRPCDVSDPAASQALVESIWEEFSGIDILINSAGRSIRRSAMASTDRFHDFERTMKINYFGTISLILAVIPRMVQKNSGHIVNISSIGCQSYPPRFAAYVASKSALDAFTHILGSEIAGTGVTATTIHMPLVRTPMIAPTSFYRSVPTMSPEEAADLVMQALVNRPREVSTRLGKFGEVVNAVAPGLNHLVMGTAFRLLPDTAAGQAASEGDGGQSRSQTGQESSAGDDNSGMVVAVLGQLMRGVHL